MAQLSYAQYTPGIHDFEEVAIYGSVCDTVCSDEQKPSEARTQRVPGARAEGVETKDPSALTSKEFFGRQGGEKRGFRYVERWADFHLMPEFIEALRIVHAKGYEAVVVTNQRGVSTGAMTQQALDDIHGNLRGELKKHGLSLRDIVVCTDGNDASPRRKPNPGMLLDAAEAHGLDLARSWMVGDQAKDVEAGRRAGCRTVFVGPKSKPVQADYHVSSMAELATFLEAHL